MENNEQNNIETKIPRTEEILNSKMINETLDKVPQIAMFEKVINVIIYTLNVIIGFGFSFTLSNATYNEIEVNFDLVPWYATTLISLLSGYIAIRLAKRKYEIEKNEMLRKMDPSKNAELNDLIQSNSNNTSYAQLSVVSLIVSYFATRFGKLIISFWTGGISILINIFLQFVAALAMTMII